MIHSSVESTAFTRSARLAFEVENIVVQTAIAIADQCMDFRICDAEINAEKIHAGVSGGVHSLFPAAGTLDL